MNQFIPVNQPLIGDLEKKLVEECLDTGWISSEGPFVSKFEDSFSKSVDRKHGIACSNGSAALDIAVAALEIGPGDEVILPSFTIISCAAAIVRSGATPVVVDCDQDTWNMSVEHVSAAITQKTAAIMVVHIYGLPVDLDPIIDLANKYSLAIIEDSAELIGGKYKGKPCGSFGTISTFSFYPNKHITTGEGGMVVTNDSALADRCRSLRNLCFQPEKRFVHNEIGWNYRMTNLQAALGLAQLQKLDSHISKKREMGLYYHRNLSEIKCLQLQPLATEYAENIFWVFGLVIDDIIGLNAVALADKLRTLGIGTRPFFYPIHKQPVFLDIGMFQDVHCPVAENLAKNGLYVPSGLNLSFDNMDYVIKSLYNIFIKH